MKFSNKDLMEMLKIKNGDVILVNNKRFIVKRNKLIFNHESHPILWLLEKDFTISPSVRIGSYFCKEDISCEKCPLRILRCHRNYEFEETLFDILENTFDFEKVSKDNAIYVTLQEMLDKEVKGEELL